MQTGQLLSTSCHLMDQKAPLIHRSGHEFASSFSQSVLPSAASFLTWTQERHPCPLACSEEALTMLPQQMCWLLVVSAHPRHSKSPRQPDHLPQPPYGSSPPREP